MPPRVIRAKAKLNIKQIRILIGTVERLAVNLIEYLNMHNPENAATAFSALERDLNILKFELPKRPILRRILTNRKYLVSTKYYFALETLQLWSPLYTFERAVYVASEMAAEYLRLVAAKNVAPQYNVYKRLVEKIEYATEAEKKLPEGHKTLLSKLVSELGNARLVANNAKPRVVPTQPVRSLAVRAPQLPARR